MSDTLSLLALPNADAQKQMVQDALIPGVNVDDLALGSPQAALGTDLKVLVWVPPETYAEDGWLYYGEVDFTFHRLDLATFFQDIDLKFAIALPTTSAAVASLLQQAFGVRFDAGDFVQENIPDSETIVNYLFRASFLSQRWTGQRTIKLYPSS